MRIWKYVFDGDIHRTVVEGALKPLCANVQGNSMCVWGEVDTSKDSQMWRFTVHATGADLPPGRGDYIGTVLQADGKLVWHVYGKEIK